jgi:tRNA (guanine10-N2)-methyltransferase
MESIIKYSKIQCVLFEKPPYNDFAVQELISLLDHFGLTHPKVFDHESVDYSFESCYTINRNNFQFYPFLYLSIDSKKLHFLQEILSRSVCIARFVEIYAEGKTIEELNKSLMGKDYIFSKENNINDTKCSDFAFNALRREIRSDETFSFVVHAQYKKLKRQEQIKHIELLDLPKISGKCNLSNPDRVFILNELYNYDSKELIRVYFGKDLFAIKRNVPFHSRYNLSKRLMLGPTSTDHNLAFLMANMAQASNEKFMIDPFLGTASILIACTHFNALCFGSEIGKFQFATLPN